MVATSNIAVLVIEDDSSDFRFLEMMLRNAPEYRLQCVDTAADGESALSTADYGLLLLDLSLPDRDGLKTVETLLSVARCPVVVLSGTDDEDVALQAVKLGAQDYLVKGQYNAILLTRTLRYAIERHRLITELDSTRQEIQRQRELHRLQTATEQLPVSSSQLKFDYSDAFEHATNQYRALLLSAMDQRIYKVENNLSEPLKALAKQLGSRQVLARDIVDIHNSALSPLLEKLNAQTAQACNEEARYLLTGLFGHLCSYYHGYRGPLPAPEPLELVVDDSQPSPRFLR